MADSSFSWDWGSYVKLHSVRQFVPKEDHTTGTSTGMFYLLITELVALKLREFFFFFFCQIFVTKIHRNLYHDLEDVKQKKI